MQIIFLSGDVKARGRSERFLGTLELVRRGDKALCWRRKKKQSEKKEKRSYDLVVGDWDRSKSHTREKCTSVQFGAKNEIQS